MKMIERTYKRLSIKNSYGDMPINNKNINTLLTLRINKIGKDFSN